MKAIRTVSMFLALLPQVATVATAQSSATGALSSTRHDKRTVQTLKSLRFLHDQSYLDLLYIMAVANPEALQVDTKALFFVQIGEHAIILQTLDRVRKTAERGIFIEASKSLGTAVVPSRADPADASALLKQPRSDRALAEFQSIGLNTTKAMVPYLIAMMQAESLVGQGYSLPNMSGEACIHEEVNLIQCTKVDSMTAMFMTQGKHNGWSREFQSQIEESKKSSSKSSGRDKNATLNATPHCGFRIPFHVTVSDETSKKDPDKPPSSTEPKKEGAVDVTDIVDFLCGTPLDGLTFGILPKIRDAIISPEDKGEISLLIRDPIKRPVEIVQDLRDKIIPKTDTGEGAKIIRDPINCTIGRLFGAC